MACCQAVATDSVFLSVGILIRAEPTVRTARTVATRCRHFVGWRDARHYRAGVCTCRRADGTPEEI
jgi:hypothetical protein